MQQRTLVRVSHRHVREFKVYWLSQMWTCGICLQPFTKKDGPVVDHSHYDGQIRGVLHRSCNGVEGMLESMRHVGYDKRVRIANRCHTGVSGADYLQGLARYFKYYSVPRTFMIHPTHRFKNERKGIPKNKRTWRTK